MALAVVRNPVIDDDILELTCFMELEHEAASLLPVISIVFISVIAVHLAFKEINCALVSEHTQS